MMTAELTERVPIPTVAAIDGITTAIYCNVTLPRINLLRMVVEPCRD